MKVKKMFIVLFSVGFLLSVIEHEFNHILVAKVTKTPFAVTEKPTPFHVLDIYETEPGAGFTTRHKVTNMAGLVGQAIATEGLLYTMPFNPLSIGFITATICNEFFYVGHFLYGVLKWDEQVGDFSVFTRKEAWLFEIILFLYAMWFLIRVIKKYRIK